MDEIQLTPEPRICMISQALPPGANSPCMSPRTAVGGVPGADTYWEESRGYYRDSRLSSTSRNNRWLTPGIVFARVSYPPLHQEGDSG